MSEMEHEELHVKEKIGGINRQEEEEEQDKPIEKNLVTLD